MMNFQEWLKSKGYYRKNNVGAWMKEGKVLSGKILHDKLKEWKNA